MKSNQEVGRTTRAQRICRREFLRAGLLAAGACLFPYRAVASVSKAFAVERALSFNNAHTGEKINTVYWQDGAYMPEALADINHILRDYRTGEVKEIDVSLLDLLFSLVKEMESNGPFHVISGYRSKATNSLLHNISKGVVTNSLHIMGKAIDIRLPGRELRSLQRAAVALRGGGVGYYPTSDFVHVDVGRIRYW